MVWYASYWGPDSTGWDEGLIERMEAMVREKRMSDEIVDVKGIFAHRDTLAAGLKTLYTVQRIVSSHVPGAIREPGELPSKDAVRTYTLALIVEVAEWVQTLDYKAWANRKEDASLRQPPQVVAEEFADILAFVGILITYMDLFGISPEEVADAYMRKSMLNWDRLNQNMGQG